MSDGNHQRRAAASGGRSAPRGRTARGTTLGAAGTAFAIVLALIALLVTFFPVPAAAVEHTFELRPAEPVAAVPPLPPPDVFPVQLVLDDDSQEGAFGVAGAGGALQFLWFNRFASPGPFRLAEVWVLFPGGANMSVGAAVQIVVYHDPDGDPTDGADLLAAFDDTIQAVDDQTFSIYPIDPPISVPDGGDVLIGVVPRFIESGVTTATNPAAFDLTASQGRSWFGVWSTDPPDPPTLPADVLLTRLDDFDPNVAGNWMIRGFGIPPNPVEIPALAPAGLAVMALLLALAAAVVLGRRRRAAAALVAAGFALLSLLAVAAPAAAQTTVDDFSTAQAQLQVPPGTEASSSVSGAGILGGSRDLAIALTSGAGNVTAEVTGGALGFTVAASTSGTLLATWDADTDPGTLDPTGLSGVDLTTGGASAFRISAAVTTNPVELEIEVFTDGANSSRAGRLLPVGAAADYFVSFSEFFVERGAGADFSDVGAITVRLAASDAGVTLDVVDAVPPQLTALKADALQADVDMDGRADPGDTLRYTIVITNPGGEAMSVDVADMVDANTTLVGGSVDSTPIAKNDQYRAVGNVTLVVDGTPRPGLLANDADPDPGDTLTLTAFDSTSSKGGTVSVTDTGTGAFTFTPAAGVRGVDTFSYTIQDVAGHSSTATVTVLIAGIVWFVDNTNSGCGSPPCGTGTQADPFQTLNQAEVASAEDDIIRVRRGDGTTGGYDVGILLKDGQKVIGGGVALEIEGETVEPADAGRAQITHHSGGHAITLGSDNVLHGADLVTADAAGMSGNTVGHLEVREASIVDAGAEAMDIDGGDLDVELDSISSDGSPGDGLSLVDVTGTMTVSGATVITNHAGRGILVANANGAILDFGSVTTEGAVIPMAVEGGGLAHGIDLSTGNTASIFVFDALDVTATDGKGLYAVGNTVSLNTTTATIDATGGSAVDISGTAGLTNGASGWTFQSLVSTQSPDTGVRLNALGDDFTVGTGSTVTNADTTAIVISNGPGVSFDLGATGVFDTVVGAGATANGVDLATGNAGATFTFDSLDVTADGGFGLRANNSGTVNVGGAGNAIAATGGAALDLTTTVVGGTWTFTSVSSTGSPGSGVSLVGVTGGAVTANGGAIGGAAGTAFNVSGGSPTVTYHGTVTQNNASRVVNIESTLGGAVSFPTGKVSGGASSTGVRINDADGNASFADLDLGTMGSPMTATALTLAGGSAGTFSFADTQIFTSGATGISANNGGIVQVTGSGNRVSATNGIAISMMGGTTIGAGGATFERVDASGATHGIRLNGAGLGFTVTGVGSTDGSGGTIQSISQRGVEVIGTDMISLANMTFTNAATSNGPGPCPDGISSGANTGCNAPIHLEVVNGATLNNVDVNGSAQHGLNGWRVTDLSLTGSTILNAGNEVGENGAKLFDLFGTSTIDGTTIDNSFRDNLRVQNDDPTPLTLTIDNSFFTDSTGGLGIQFSGRGSSNMNLVLEDSEVTGNGSSGIQAQGSDDTTASGGSFDFRIRRVVFENNAAAAIDMGAVGQSPLYFEIMDNGTVARPIVNHGSHVINVNQGGSPSAPFTTATVDGIVSGNVIGSGPNGSGTSAGSGIRLVENQSGTVRVRISNNTVKGWTEHGVFVIARDAAGGAGSGSSHVDVTIQGNTVNDANGSFPIAGIKVQGGAANLADELHDICATIGKNTADSEKNVVTVGGFPEAGIRVQQRFNTTMSLYQGASASTDPATVLGDNNTISASPATSATGTVPVVTTACDLPLTPL